MIIIKTTRYTELEKGYPYKPKRHQNHDTKQDIEQQKEIEIKMQKS